MIRRILQETIEKSLRQFPVVGIVGSRQAGKTTLARMLGATLSQDVVYLDLELPSDFSKLQDPELYLSRLQDSLVIIDEIQRMPSLFPLLRALVDQNRKAGRFLILGSASPELSRKASESLAGRIAYHELPPFLLPEIGNEKAQELWLHGGYPASILTDCDDDRFAWREAFIKTYLEMDIPQLGIHIPAAQLRRFWTMLAHSHGQLWNASRIAASMNLSAPTIKKYLDILEDTFIVRQLQPFYPNIKKRVTKSPKIYIRDSGLLHTLLKIRNFDELHSHPTLGSSWEGFVIEQIIGIAPANWEAYFYRTTAGAEVDLLLFNDRNEPIAIEIKYSLSPKVSRGFWNSLEDLQCTKGFIVYPGEDSYPVSSQVNTLPLKSISTLFDK